MSWWMQNFGILGTILFVPIFVAFAFVTWGVVSTALDDRGKRRKRKEAKR